MENVCHFKHVSADKDRTQIKDFVCHVLNKGMNDYCLLLMSYYF